MNPIEKLHETCQRVAECYYTGADNYGERNLASLLEQLGEITGNSIEHYDFVDKMNDVVEDHEGGMLWEHSDVTDRVRLLSRYVADIFGTRI